VRLTPVAPFAGELSDAATAGLHAGGCVVNVHVADVVCAPHAAFATTYQLYVVPSARGPIERNGEEGFPLYTPFTKTL
jgi:hypothetical protein